MRCSQEVLDATINKLRERAYNGTNLEYPRVTEGSQQQLRTVIRTERFIEMAWEGHRYSDLIRWKIAGKVFNRPIYFLNRPVIPLGMVMKVLYRLNTSS
jgi:hypothetical protein